MKLRKSRMIGRNCPTGPGGRDCPCCGDAPKDRRRSKRRAKRSERAKVKKYLRNFI